MPYHLPVQRPIVKRRLRRKPLGALPRVCGHLATKIARNKILDFFLLLRAIGVVGLVARLREEKRRGRRERVVQPKIREGRRRRRER